MYLAPSSSESEDECLHYTKFRTNSYQMTPIYPGLGQPLIYYAEVKPKKCKRRSRENQKNNSNCFVKAFRWYTKEHVPFKNNNSSNNVMNKDIKGFATWLDEKYSEYQTDRRTDHIKQTTCILSQKSTLDVMNDAKIYDNKIKSSRKFPILKRSWNNRQKSLNKGDEIVQSSHSIEIILKPKNLSCPASECCQRSDLQNNAFISTSSALHMTLRPTSRSLTSVLKEKEIYIIPFDVLQDASQDELKHRVEEIKTNDQKKITQIFPKDRISTFRNKSRNNVSCQCDTFENTSRKFDKKYSNICHCYKRKSEVEVIRKVAIIPVNEPNTDYRKSSGTTFVNDSVQTSDYSINFDTTRNDPVFMKIMCPHKS